MRARLTRFAAVLAALAALAVGGSALASAASNKAKPSPAPPAQESSAVDNGPNVQQGDQSAPDTSSAGEQAGEQAGSDESSKPATANDGSGGYADTVANADTQQTGEH